MIKSINSVVCTTLMLIGFCIWIFKSDVIYTIFSTTSFTDGKMYCGGGFDGVCDSLTFGTKSDGTFIIRDETSKVDIPIQVSPKMIARRIDSQFLDPLHIGTYPLTVTLDQEHSGYFVNFLRRHGVQFDLQSIESDRFINVIIQ